MSLLKPQSERDNEYRQIGLLAAVPALLLAGPLVGYFGGHWLDEWLGTDPWLMTLGVLFGLGSAGVEIYQLVKKSASLEKRDDEGHTGT